LIGAVLIVRGVASQRRVTQYIFILNQSQSPTSNIGPTRRGNRPTSSPVSLSRIQLGASTHRGLPDPRTAPLKTVSLCHVGLSSDGWPRAGGIRVRGRGMLH